MLRVAVNARANDVNYIYSALKKKKRGRWDENVKVKFEKNKRHLGPLVSAAALTFDADKKKSGMNIICSDSCLFVLLQQLLLLLSLSAWS